MSGARQRWLGPAMFLPAVLYVVALVGVPFVLAFLYSVGDVKVGSVGYHFVGAKNFASVLQNPTFLRSLRNSFVFTVSSQILVLIGANILALVLKNAFRGRRFVRSMMSVILVHTWHMLPFATVIILAGWTAIPRDIPEAAAVDGAGFFRRMFQIELPMMLPIINVAVLFGVIFTFTDMTVIYILTRGGPYDTTQVLPSMAFFTGILGSDLAEGAAISIFLVPLLVAGAWLMLRSAHRAEVT